VPDSVVSVLLGIIEGLTEFLPVSSTAHLRLIEALWHIDLSDGYWKMYTIVIQLGAILCLPVYFRSRIVAYVSTFPRGERGDRGVFTHPLSLTMVAFVVTLVPTFLLTKLIGKHLESLAIIGTSLLVGGIVMWWVDRLNADAEMRGPHATDTRVQTWRMDDMSLKQAAWIGACQVLSAIFPGTSRSMSTIAAGQLAGMSREAALEFSFFLSIPTMCAATAYDLYKSLKGGGANPIGVTHIDAHGWTLLAIGFVTAFIVAYASVGGLITYVRRRGFTVFAVYRILLGAGVLLIAA
jgi:undecaprenyl-diphosphatase